jgi:hypothetical protein
MVQAPHRRFMPYDTMQRNGLASPALWADIPDPVRLFLTIDIVDAEVL